MRRALGIAAAVALTVTTAVPAVAAAQETPTERSAAADVIRRMNELERSLALPQLVARLTARDAPTRWSRAPASSWTASSSRWPTTSRATPKWATRRSAR